MTDLIIKAPRVNFPFYVYRGERNYKPIYVDPEDEHKYIIDNLNYKKGSEYEYQGFNSFTLAPWIALQFNAGSPCCIYRLKITPNVPYLFLPMSDKSFYSEYEVLLPPSKFKVTNVSRIVSPLSREIGIKVYDIEYNGPIDYSLLNPCITKSGEDKCSAPLNIQQTIFF